MSTNVRAWYDFVLQQMAAESYLDGWNALSLQDRVFRLNFGNNNFGVETNQPNVPVLPGTTRITATQADDSYALREPLSAYTGHIDHEMVPLRIENARDWNINAALSNG